MLTFPETIMKDSFSQLFDDHDELHKFLADLDKDTRWESIPAKTVSFVPLDSLTPEQLLMGGEACYHDTRISGLPVAVKLDDGRILAIRPYLFKNMKQHHRDNAAILTDMLNCGNVSAMCDHLNMSKPFLKKNILMMTRGQKISGWFSEFNANWGQSAQFKFVEASMHDAFPEFQFGTGEVSHLYSTARYTLGTSLRDGTFSSCIGDKVLGPYLDAWEAAGGDRAALEKAVPQCWFTTGESGLTSITLSPVLKMSDGQLFFLGGSLSVNHRGDDSKVWDKFTAFPDQIAVLYQRGMKALSSLCSRRISNPYACTTHILLKFRSSVPTDYLKDVASTMEMFYPPEDKEMTCMAIDVYNAINEMVARAGVKQSPLKRLQNMELVARLMVANWDDYDKAVPAKVFGKSTGDDSEVDWLSM